MRKTTHYTGNGGVKDNLLSRRGEGFKDQDILRSVLLFDFMCEYSSLNIGASLEKMKMPVKWKAPHGKLRSECFAYFAITLTIVFSLRSNDSF